MKSHPTNTDDFQKYSMFEFSFSGGSKKSFVDGHLRYFNIIDHPTGPRARLENAVEKGSLWGPNPRWIGEFKFNPPLHFLDQKKTNAIMAAPRALASVAEFTSHDL